MALQQYLFGSGSLYMKPFGVANARPVQVGTLQDVSVDFSWSEKTLQGASDAAAAIARGALKISGKVKSAKFSVTDLGLVVFGTSPTLGSTEIVNNEGLPNGTVIPSGGVVTMTHSATFVEDLGVVNVNSGVQLTPVASAPTTGEYTVAAGVYTFATADVGQLVAISYSYTQSTAGQSLTYYAQPMGLRPTFKMVLSNSGFMNNPSYVGQPLDMILWSAGINKFSLDFKNEDFNIPESDFSAGQDYMGRVFTIGADS